MYNSHLYIDNKDAIRALVNTSTAQKKKRFKAARKKLESYNVQFIQQADDFKLNGVADGEKNLVQQFIEAQIG